LKRGERENPVRQRCRIDFTRYTNETTIPNPRKIMYGGWVNISPILTNQPDTAVTVVVIFAKNASSSTAIIHLLSLFVITL
jgi:hypothetical protein